MKLSRAGMRLMVLALCTATAGVIPMMGQDSSAGAPKGPGDRMGRPGPAHMQERQLERMTKELNLTPEQVTGIKAIQAEAQKQMSALRDDTATAATDKREKMMAIHQTSRDQVVTLLTAEQKKKFEAMQAHMREQRQERKDGEGASAPAAADAPAAPPQ